MQQRILLTGATGFIGSHVLQFLKQCTRWHIICLGRNENKLKSLGEEYIVYDLSQKQVDCYQALGRPSLLIHLAWENLGNFRALDHIEHNVINNYNFLKNMILGGLEHLAIAGTCLEYGLKNGCLSEHLNTEPVVNYGLGKDVLRRYIEALNRSYSFHFKWLRLFYTYGPGQNDSSLLPRIARAVLSGSESLDTSGGEQLRDYLPVGEMAELLAKVSLQTTYDGIFNICSGRPISIRNFIEKHVKKMDSKLKLNLGALPYLDYEPMAFWGDVTKLNMAIKAFDNEYRNEKRE